MRLHVLQHITKKLPFRWRNSSSNWRNRALSSQHAPYVGLILFVFALIFFTNFPFSTWLTGWDNLHPEFNVWLNIKRTFSVWYYEGLGVMGGHGYAATLLHSLFIGLLSIVLPDFLLRSIFTFLMLLVGGIGCYLFVDHLGGKSQNSKISAMFAALFYMVNVGTVQNFYIQLESFIVHFAFLPWFVLTLHRYYSQPNRRNLFQFALVSLLSTPQGFIPPLFIVVSIYFLVISVAHVVKSRQLATSILAGLILFITNAFWLLPVAYYTLTTSNVYLQSYNNQMSTPDFIEKNRQYGTVKDVALLRGFLFEARDTASNGEFFYFLYPWKQHFDRPLVALIGYLLFAGVAISWVKALVKRHSYLEVALCILLLLSFTALATQTQPFALFSYILQHYVPIFKQAFRVAFTKFSISTAFLYAVFLGLGLKHVLELLKFRTHRLAVVITSSVLLLVISWPIYFGNFIYKRVRIDIPQQYFELFTFFKTQPKHERIMNLPQGWNWGWSVYDWDYSGSGFLWYGIEQPIMDRAFDVWSNYQENYYWELSRALYGEDYAYFDMLLDKYDISWILFDPNVLSYPSNQADIYTERIGEYLRKNPRLYLYKQFSSEQNNAKDMYAYRVATSYEQSPVTIINTVPNVLKDGFWENIDTAYATLGTYVQNQKLYDYTYFPFSNLFSSRRIPQNKDNTVNIEDSDNLYTFTKLLPEQIGSYLRVMQYASSETILPVKIEVTSESAKVSKLNISPLVPEITVGTNRMQSSDKIVDSISFPMTSNQRVGNILINNQDISLTDERSQTAFLYLENDNHILIIDRDGNELFQSGAYRWSHSLVQVRKHLDVQTVNSSQEIQVTIPKILSQYAYQSQSDPYFTSHSANNCSGNTDSIGKFSQEVLQENSQAYIRFSSKNSHNCYSIDLPHLTQKFAYIIKIIHRNQMGSGLRFAVKNKQVDRIEIEQNLDTSSQNWNTSYFILPPMKQDGMGYVLSFDNISESQETIINDLLSVEVTWLPLEYLNAIQFSKQPGAGTSRQDNIGSKQYGQFVYAIKLPFSEETDNIIKLSQAYHPGWVAITHTSGNWNILSHIKVNNWANGWLLDNDKRGTIYIFFWPQVFEYLGFGLLFGGGLVIFLKGRTKPVFRH